MSASNVHKKCKMQQFLCVCVCECVQDWIKCTHFVEMCKLDPISMWMLNLHFVKMRRIAINIAIESADSYISTKPILFTRYTHTNYISIDICSVHIRMPFTLTKNALSFVLSSVFCWISSDDEFAWLHFNRRVLIYFDKKNQLIWFQKRQKCSIQLSPVQRRFTHRTLKWCNTNWSSMKNASGQIDSVSRMNWITSVQTQKCDSFIGLILLHAVCYG